MIWLLAMTYFSLGKVTPWLQGKPTDDPWVLLHLAESSDPDIRRIGLSALSEDHGWEGTVFILDKGQSKML